MPHLENGNVVKINENVTLNSNVTKPASLSSVKTLKAFTSKIAVNNVKIIKKDGTLEDYNEQKIIDAVNKSARRDNYNFTEQDYQLICNTVLDEIDEEEFDDDEIPVDFVHNVVEKTLLNNFPSVGKQYQQYRNYKLDFVRMMDKVYEESQKIMYIGDKENSNTDSALVSTKRSLIFNELNRELYKKFFLTLEERQAINDGYIYIQDMSARRDTMNCCLFNVKEVLTGGFEMGNIWYNEPKTLDVAFDVIGDITLSAASCQYGKNNPTAVHKNLVNA